MAVLLRELYGYVNHTEMKLIAGQAGMNRNIRWMHMVESLEISSFLEGEEISFITGIGLKNSTSETLLDLVREIYKNGGSAVVVNIGPYIERIGEDVISFCNEKDMPLFEVPWSVYMARIMHIFGKKITEAERSTMELESALKFAVYTPQSTELYCPVLEQHGFSRQSHYRLISIYLQKSPRISDEDAIKAINKIKLQTQVSLNDRHSYFPFVLEGTLLLLLCDWPDAYMKSSVAFASSAWAVHVPPSCRLYISISGNVGGLEKIHECYGQTNKIRRLQMRRKEMVESYDELGPYKILLNQHHSTVLKAYYQEILSKLDDYDQLHKGQLTDVLKTYLESNGSINKTAELLYIHRNTVNYKLHKAEEILNCDLSLFSTRFSIQLALLIKEIL